MKLLTTADRIAVAKAKIKPQRRRSAIGIDLKKYALEAKDRRYITLICDHYTTPQEVELLWTFNPAKGKKFWCGICGKWVLRKPKPKTAQIPPEPMF